jgi:pimeloyl-ACP methyl ester carboxylesterase
MNVESELVTIPTDGGRKLWGVLWQPRPGVPRRNILVILSHGGLSHKLGANRVQYNLGRFFASRGCTVFRFDPEGMGDSDGEVAGQPREDLFGNIESGLFKESYRHAFGYLAKRFADHRWVVSGVCGGAISSLLGSAGSPHPISGYALISCPVILDGARFDYARREPPATAVKYLRTFLPKLFSPKAILRFLTFQSDYKRMWKHIRSLLLRATDKVLAPLRRAKKKAPQLEAASNPATPASKPAVGLSPHFVKATKEAMRKSNVLFIYGDNDGFLWEFNDLYAAAHLSASQRENILRVVAHANHMFVWREWQDQAFEMIDGWLASNIAAAPAA